MWPIVRRIVITVVVALAAAAGLTLAPVGRAAAVGAVPGTHALTGAGVTGGPSQTPPPRSASGQEVSRLLAGGTRLWSRRYSGPGNGQSNDDVARSVAVSPDGGTAFVTGYRMADTQDFTTIAYSVSTGATLWARYYNGPANSDDQASSMTVSPDGGTVFATGYSTGSTSGEDDATVAYNAATGAPLWARRYKGPANSTDAAYSLAAATTGTVVVTGIGYGVTSGADYRTIAYTGGG
jgi:hypothetical protein